MKTIGLYFFMSSCLLGSLQLHAQFQSGGARRSGAGLFKIGLNISNLSFEADGESSARAGIAMGLAPAFPLAGHWYMKPELSLSSKGAKVDYSSSSGVFNGEIRYRINYLELPVLAGYEIRKRLSIEAGPYLAIKAGSNFDFDGTFFYGYGRLESDEIAPLDYGLNVGLKIGPLGIRYIHGLANITSGKNIEDFLGTAHNRTVQLYLQTTGALRQRQKNEVRMQ